jgi:cytochrome c oxidase cbb3-type subunit 2
VYAYFLIFAQFAFLKRLASLGVADTHLKVVMAAMATGGILLSLLTPRVHILLSARLRLGIGFFVSAIAALLSLVPLRLTAATVISFLIGSGLGLVTVTLVSHLRQFAGERNPLLVVGLGTGAGYFVCNIPSLFTASPQVQTLAAGIFCLAGICIISAPAASVPQLSVVRLQPTASFLQVLGSLTALVWLDSAAFFIIQNTPSLKVGSWQGSEHLWGNGALHFSAAVSGVFLLRRRGPLQVLIAAFFALASACLLLQNSHRLLLASMLYPIGVSLYSVVLVAYPSLIAPAASTADRGRITGWIYAIAGWIGSAMGIGMAQNLGRVPLAFVIATGALVLAPQLFAVLRQRKREVAVASFVILASFLAERVLRPVQASLQLTQVERGRQVYISEGCIHCHSQYVRPNTADVIMWGPQETLQEIRLQRPPLIGNRRQGPDLSQVGVRRSALWLKAHFYDPSEVSGSSIMPSYAFLFRDDRGDDLVAYLESLRGAGAAQHIAAEEVWQPASNSAAQATVAEGQRLYQRDCTTCHSPSGSTRVRWQSNFKELPVDFTSGSYNERSLSGSEQQHLHQLEQITKFGIPGTDMPGHEYLPDRDIVSISLWLSQSIDQSNPKHQNAMNSGEER